MSIEKEMVRIACKALDDKKAKDIKIIDIHEVSVIADYFVIASASNQNQVQAVSYTHLGYHALFPESTSSCRASGSVFRWIQPAYDYVFCGSTWSGDGESRRLF